MLFRSYVAGSYAAKINFSEEEIAEVSAKQYQLQLTIITMLSLFAGSLAEVVPLPLSLASGVPLVLLFTTFLKVFPKARTRNLREVHHEF